MDRKVNTKFWNLVNAISPGVSKNITWSDAWEKLSEWGNFNGGLETKISGETLMEIYIDDKKVKGLSITNARDEKDRDWNWDQIFSQTLEYIFEEAK